MSTSFYIPERAMAIAAHPDDLEFGCAGTIARWTKAGCEVSYVLVTSGDVGIANRELSREEVRDIREREQRAAADILGVSDVVFLRYPDGMVENTMELRKNLVREIRRFKPDVVITLDPTVLYASENYINHPDHRAAGMAALDAVFPAAGQPHVFEELADEGLEAHKVKKVYVMGWQNPNTWINISDTIDAKIQALSAHKSQMDEARGQNPEWDHEVMMRQWAADHGRGKEMDFAEAFRVITLVND